MNKDKLFFLYLPHNAVHFLIYPGKAFQGHSKNRVYGDWIEEGDWSVDPVLDRLRELKLETNPLVIFTSDNGETARAVNAPLRGHKGTTWEGGMRAPTLARWPGKIPTGTATDAIPGMMEVLPTLAKLAGGSAPTDRKIDGGEIWPLLVGDGKQGNHWGGTIPSQGEELSKDEVSLDNVRGVGKRVAEIALRMAASAK